MKARDEYMRRAVSRTFDKVQASAVFLALFTDAYKREPEALMQLGMATVLDKPLLLLVAADIEIPENVRRLARAIEVYTNLDDLSVATDRLLVKARDLGLVPR
jgi:hypothetical protein